MILSIQYANILTSPFHKPPEDTNMVSSDFSIFSIGVMAVAMSAICDGGISLNWSYRRTSKGNGAVFDGAPGSRTAR